MAKAFSAVEFPITLAFLSCQSYICPKLTLDYRMVFRRLNWSLTVSPFYLVVVSDVNFFFVDFCLNVNLKSLETSW